MASSSTELPEAPPPPPATAPEQQQQPSAQDQLQSAAAVSPDLQQQTSNISNGSNSNSNSNDPFQCLWQGCRERTQSAEALYVCDFFPSFYGTSDSRLGPRVRSSYRSQEHQQSQLEVWMGQLQHLRG